MIARGRGRKIKEVKKEQIEKTTQEKWRSMEKCQDIVHKSKSNCCHLNNFQFLHHVSFFIHLFMFRCIA